MKHAAVKLERGRSKAGTLTHYDPEKGLKSVAVMEAAEKHFARAKDARQLFQAIATKIQAMADYVVWRDGVVVPSRETGYDPKTGRRTGVAPVQPRLPDADPKKHVIHRWRKAFCSRDADGATVADSVKVADAVKDAVRKATRLIEHQNKPKAPKPKKQKKTIPDAEKIRKATEDAQYRSQRIVEQQNAGTVRGTEGTGEFERYTPAKYIEAARAVLGGIDLDPASCEVAQRTVKADRYFTVSDDGLKQEWSGRSIWLNPPYHRDLGPKFVEKLIAEHAAGRVQTAIMLTNNSTDTEWFAHAAAACNVICFTHGRINFLKENGDLVLPTQGQAFFYFGADVDGFRQGFAEIGFVVQPMRGQTKVDARALLVEAAS